MAFFLEKFKFYGFFPTSLYLSDFPGWKLFWFFLFCVEFFTHNLIFLVLHMHSESIEFQFHSHALKLNTTPQSDKNSHKKIHLNYQLNKRFYIRKKTVQIQQIQIDCESWHGKFFSTAVKKCAKNEQITEKKIHFYLISWCDSN